MSGPVQPADHDPLLADLYFHDQSQRSGAVGLSFFPLTGPGGAALAHRLRADSCRTVAANIAVLVVCAILAILFAARAFRLGMLSYGKRLTLRQMMGKEGQA